MMPPFKSPFVELAETLAETNFETQELREDWIEQHKLRQLLRLGLPSKAKFRFSVGQVFSFLLGENWPEIVRFRGDNRSGECIILSQRFYFWMMIRSIIYDLQPDETLTNNEFDRKFETFLFDTRRNLRRQRSRRLARLTATNHLSLSYIS